MESGPVRSEELLVLASKAASERQLQNQLDPVNVASVDNIAGLRDYLNHHIADVVLLDEDLTNGKSVELIHELRVMDNDPGILVLSPAADPIHVAALYNSGCDRWILKREEWANEAIPAVRQILRMRRLQDQNIKIRAKLTEANVLLEEKNRRLDEFSLTLAHDIRGPLGAISMKLDYILDTYAKSLDQRCFDLLDRSRGSSQRLVEIVQSMYEFAKIGAKAARMELVSLSTIVEDVVRDLNFDQTLDIQIGVSNLPTVWGNTELLRRVFLNLLSNAVKYSNRDNIIVNVSGVRKYETTLGRFAQIAVEDNGPGIPPEDLPTIFKLFSRGKETPEGKEGLGLGLSVVQRIIELHLGRISVESKLGEGTKFILTLPTERVELA